MNHLTQMEQYIWLIDTIRRIENISHRDLSVLWEHNTKLSNGKPLNRSTLRRWRKIIQDSYGIVIGCKKAGNYHYCIKNPETFEKCPCLGELFRECLHRFNRENVVDDNIVRQDLKDCMFYLKNALDLYNGDYTHWIGYSVSREVPYHIRFMSKAEIEYTVSLLKEWFKEGYLPIVDCIVWLSLDDLSKHDLSKRILGYNDRELVRIISEHSEKAVLFLKRHLGNVIVRKLFYKKANEGDANYAYHLADYLYQKRRYEKAFAYLTKIDEENHFDTGRYLGLMYFYGRGVARDYNKAREYLECLDHSSDSEIIYALGETYMRAGSFDKAVELYQKHVVEPYVDRSNKYYLKIIKRFMEIRSTFGIPDWIIMTVKISRSNLRCEFSVELPAFCRILLNWGEPQSSILIRQSGEKASKITFRHTYRHPGEYKIDFETTCIHSVEAIEFSRYKKQLKEIEFLTGRGLKKISLIGQCLKSLVLPPSPYLSGLICRDNYINNIDLSESPRLTHLDCSKNPISKLILHRNSPLTKACVRATMLDRQPLVRILQSNRGGFCNMLDYDSLEPLDMRLEYYFRCTSWDRTKKYLRKKLDYYYYHALTECEQAFNKLKEMARKNNRTPHKNGFLEVDADFVADFTIVGHEEFFLEKNPWSVSLATKVRDMCHKEPWMRCELTQPEYYVASCLVNMGTPANPCV